MDNRTVDETAQAAQQDIAQNNPVPALTSVPAYRPPADDMQLWEAKRKREASTTSLDYATAALHQDDFLNGMVANIVGHQMADDPNFNILDPKVYKEWADGLPDDLKHEMLDVRSAPQAAYRRGLLADKIREQTILGDLGWKGNTLRAIGGFVEPGNLAFIAGSMGLGPVIGGATQLGRANKALRLTTELADGPAKVAAVAKATSELKAAADAASGMKAAAGTVAAGTGINVGMEKLRQEFNFEDDPQGLLHAGLMGMILSTPFAALSARGMARMRESAGHELDLLNVIQAANAHPDVAIADPASLPKVREMHNYIADVVDGEHPITDLKEPALTADSEHAPAPSLAELVMDHEPSAQPTAMELAFQKAAQKDLPTVEKTGEARQPTRAEGAAAAERARVESDIARGEKKTAKQKAAEENAMWAAYDREHGLEPPESFMPEGFKPGSVGAAASEGGPVHAGVSPTYMRSGRIDIYATLNRNPNPVFQELAHKMIKDAIATSRTEAQSFTASERKRNIQRTLGGYFHTEAQAAFNEAANARQLPWYSLKRRQFSKDFYDAVTLVNRGDPDVLRTHADIAPQLQRAAKAAQDSKRQMLERAQRAEVQGAMGVTPDDTYVNRVFDFDNIARLERTHGDQIHELLARAMPWRSRGGMEEAVHAGKRYLNAVRKLQFAHVGQDMQLYAHDMKALRSELERAGLTQGEINEVVDAMFEHKASETDAGNATNLKYRFKLDENTSMTMRNGENVKVSDLLENDSRVLMDKYLNSMAGHTALAEMGIKSRADFQAWMKDAEDHQLTANNDIAQYNRGKQLLEDMYDNITGRPMSTAEFNTAARVANATRALTRSMVLGQLGIAAAFEMHKAIVLAGLRAALTQMPTLLSVIRAVRAGHQFDSALAHDIRTLWGFGSESAAAHAREHALSEYTYDRGLTRYENVANEASHVVDRLSGNAFFTAATRELSTRFMIQKYADFAYGRKSLSAKMRERMVANGVDNSMIDPLLRDMKQFTERDGDRVVGIRWEDWQRENQATFDGFQTVVEREVRDAIQEHDIGETMPWMHTTLGKVWAELRTFMLVGHAKSSLRALHFRDATSLQQLMVGIVSDTLAYTLQQSINFGQNSQELQRRLSPEMIAGSVFQRMSLMGMFPGMVQTGAFLTGQKLPGTTTNTDVRNMLNTPSLQVAGNLLTGARAIGQSLNPNAQSMTQSDMRTAFEAYPGGNLWGARNVADWLSQSYPRHVPRQQ